jgi:hypothetical protein
MRPASGVTAKLHSGSNALLAKSSITYCSPSQVVGMMIRAEGGQTPMRARLCSVFGALILAGCASKASDVAPNYVSPMQYDAYNCSQLAEEAQRVSARASAAAGAQDSQATKDAVATTVGVIVFWPALFFIGGDKQNAAELGRLRGEMEAIEQASIRRKCGIQFRATPG